MRCREYILSLILGSLILAGCNESEPKTPLTVKGYSWSKQMLTFVLDQKDQINKILPERLRLQFRYATLDQLIAREILATQAKEKGITVTDKEVFEMFKNRAFRLSNHDGLLPLRPNEEATKEWLTNWLAKWEIPLDEFVKDQKQELLSLKFRTQYENSIAVDEELVKSRFKLHGTRVSVEYSLISPKKFRDKVKLDPALKGAEREKQLNEKSIELTKKAIEEYKQRLRDGETMSQVFVSTKAADPTIDKTIKPRAPFKFYRTLPFFNDPDVPLGRLGHMPDMVKKLFEKKDDEYVLKAGDILPTIQKEDVFVLARIKARQSPNWTEWQNDKERHLRSYRIQKAFESLQPQLLKHCTALLKQNQIHFQQKILIRSYKYDPKSKKPKVGDYKPCTVFAPEYKPF